MTRRAGYTVTNRWPGNAKRTKQNGDILMPAINVTSSDPRFPGVFGENTASGDGVFGQGGASGRGVVGVSDGHTGVEGTTKTGTAVFGNATGNGRGVFAGSQDGAGVGALSQSGEAVHGETHSPAVAAIAGFNLNPAGTGAAIFGQKAGQVGHAGFFDGNVAVTGSLNVHGTDFNGLVARVQALENLAARVQALENLAARVQALENKVQQQGGAIVGLEGQITNLAQRVAALGG